MLPAKKPGSLQQRVNSILRSEPESYAVEQSEQEATVALMEMLHSAETDLRVAQERVNRIKWELAKTQS